MNETDQQPEPWWKRIFHKEQPEKPEIIPPWWGAEWNEIKTRFPIGSYLMHAGVKMIVAAYDRDHRSQPPYLYCDYVSQGGEIHGWDFRRHEWECIRRENPENSNPENPA